MNTVDIYLRRFGSILKERKRIELVGGSFIALLLFFFFKFVLAPWLAHEVGHNIVLGLWTDEGTKIAVESIGVVFAVGLFFLVVSWLDLRRRAIIDTSVIDYEQAIMDSTGVFMTSVMPTMIGSFERRFRPDLVRQLTLVAGAQARRANKDNKDRATTVFVCDDTELGELRLPVFDGAFARVYAMLSAVLGLNMAIMKMSEFGDLIQSTGAGDHGGNRSPHEYDFCQVETSTGKRIFVPLREVAHSSIEYGEVKSTNGSKYTEMACIADVLRQLVLDKDGKVKSDYQAHKYLSCPACLGAAHVQD